MSSKAFPKIYVDPDTRVAWILKFYRDPDLWDLASWDSLGRMAFAHPRHDLGHSRANSLEANARWIGRHLPEEAGINAESDPRAITEALKLHAIWKPVWLVDHTNLSYYFEDPKVDWDSMRLGWMFCTYEEARKWWSLPEGTSKEELQERTFRQFDHELERYTLIGDGAIWSWELQQTNAPIPTAVPASKLAAYAKHVSNAERVADGWEIATEDDAVESMIEALETDHPELIKHWWPERAVQMEHPALIATAQS